MLLENPDQYRNTLNNQQVGTTLIFLMSLLQASEHSPKANVRLLVKAASDNVELPENEVGPPISSLSIYSEGLAQPGVPLGVMAEQTPNVLLRTPGCDRRRASGSAVHFLRGHEQRTDAWSCASVRHMQLLPVRLVLPSLERGRQGCGEPWWCFSYRVISARVGGAPGALTSVPDFTRLYFPFHGNVRGWG